MQRVRADARQLSRASSPANNGTSPGRLIPPRWDREGNRISLPPALWPPACLGCLHPMPVDLSALGDELKIPLRSPLGDPKAIRLSTRESLSDGAAADGDHLSTTGLPAPATWITSEDLTRRLRLQLKKSWEGFGPAIKIGCGLKAIHPDVAITAVIADTQTDKVGVLVHGLDLKAWLSKPDL